MLFATPQFAIYGYVGSFRLGWHPRIYVTSVSISPDIMKIAAFVTSRCRARSRSPSSRTRPPPSGQRTRPSASTSRSVKRYLPGATADDVFNYYGMAVAYTMVDTLRKAGRNPTRASCSGPRRISTRSTRICSRDAH